MLLGGENEGFIKANSRHSFWVYAFSQILCIYVALHFFMTSLMKVNIYDEVFEENKYVQKDTLPTKCGILLLRLKWIYSWRSLIRDVALAVAETGSSWCVYSCTLKSVGTDFSTTGLPFLPLLKRQVTSVNMLVLLSWKIGWTGCRHPFKLSRSGHPPHMKPCCLKYKTVGSLQACCGSPDSPPCAADQAPSWRQWWRMFLGLGAFVNELLNSPSTGYIEKKFLMLGDYILGECQSKTWRNSDTEMERGWCAWTIPSLSVCKIEKLPCFHWFSW